MLTNSSGEATATFTYSAYGQPAGSTGTQSTPLGYAGQYTNEQSSLQYLRARVYDPVTGQFLTRDPIEALTRQPYAYAYDNPLAFVDPSGECVFGLPCPDIDVHIDLCDPSFQVGPKSLLCMDSQEIVDTSASAGDNILSVPGSGTEIPGTGWELPRLSLGPPLRDLLGIDNVNECSAQYQGTSLAAQAFRDFLFLKKIPSRWDTLEEWNTAAGRRLNEKFSHVRRDWPRHP